MPLPVGAPAPRPLRLLASLLGAGGYQVRPAPHRVVLWRQGGVGPPAPPTGWPWSPDLRIGDALRGTGLLAGRRAGGGGRRPRLGSAPPGAAHGGSPMGPAALDDASSRASPRTRSGMGHRPDHAWVAPGGVEAALLRGGPAVRGAGGLHGPRGPPCGRGRPRGPRRRPAGRRPGTRPGRQ